MAYSDLQGFLFYFFADAIVKCGVIIHVNHLKTNDVMLHVTLNVLIMEMTGKLILPSPSAASISLYRSLRYQGNGGTEPEFTRDHPCYVITSDVF